MTDVVATFDAYSKLNCLDLLTEIPTCEYEGNIDGIHVFSIEDPDALVTLLCDLLGDVRMDSKGYYHYSDGTIAKFVKKRKAYEFKKFRAVFARIKLR